MTQRKFKNDNGVFLLKELFYETASNRENVLYTLKNEEHEGYPSLYQLYLNANDPTEYTFAKQTLYGWDHWERLKKCSWFKAIYNSWAAELEIKLKSEALASIIHKANGNSREAFQAAKFVAEYGDKGRGAGRPSKQEIKKAATEIATSNAQEEADFIRLIKGQD